MVGRIWCWLFGNAVADEIAVKLQRSLEREHDATVAKHEVLASNDVLDRQLREYARVNIIQAETINKLRSEVDELKTKTDQRNATISNLESQIRELKRPLFNFDQVGEAMRAKSETACKTRCCEKND